MKQFSLEEYLKNPERKVVTRNGRPVRIICIDRKDVGAERCVMALIYSESSNSESVFAFNKNGFHYAEGDESIMDLFFAPQIQKRWSFMSIAPAVTERALIALPLYETREEAEKLSGDCHVIEITWEE